MLSLKTRCIFDDFPVLKIEGFQGGYLFCDHFLHLLHEGTKILGLNHIITELVNI